MEHVLDAAESSDVKIVDAWSIECINHGQSAVLNEKVLADSPEYFLCQDYARAVARFLTVRGESNIPVDFSKRNLHAVAHSMGAVAMIWLQQEKSISLKFNSLILVDPVLKPVGDQLASSSKYWVAATYQRRDVWPSRKAALRDLQTSKSHGLWDHRVLELFVQYGLRQHPAAHFPIEPFNGVSLACSRYQEAACYRGGRDLTEPMAVSLGRISKLIPVHFIWAEIHDSVPGEVKANLMDEAKGGVRATAGRVANAGHLAVQSSPLGVANALLEGLNICKRSRTTSKL